MVNAYETLYKLNDLRSIKKYCDVVLIVEGQEFHCHRAILAAAVEYFEKMFGSSFLESESLAVELKDVSKTYFDIFLNYIYTGHIEFNQLFVKHLLTLSSYFSIDSLTEKCVEYIRSSLDIKTVLEFHMLADKIGCTWLKELTTDFIESNFSRIAATEKFLKIPFSMVNEFISSDTTYVEKEEFMFRIINEWIKHDFINRKEYFPELFEKICFKFVKSNYIANEVLGNDLVVEYRDKCDQVISTKGNCQPRAVGSPKFIYLFGERGVMKNNATRRENVNIGVVCWNGSSFNDVPCMDWRTHDYFKVNNIKVVHHNSLLYMFAYGSDWESKMNYFCHFRSDKWRSLNVLSGSADNLVSSDGFSRIYMSSVTGVYYYTADCNTWNVLIAEGYTNDSGKEIKRAALVDWKSNIFSVGGHNTTILKVYDLRVGRWESRTNAPEVVNYQSGVTVFNNDIYVTNGECDTLIYDIRQDNWRSGSKMKTSRLGHSLVEQNKKLHAIGGLISSQRRLKSDTNYCEMDIYDPVLDEWTNGPLMTGFKHNTEIVGVSCNQLYNSIL